MTNPLARWETASHIYTVHDLLTKEFLLDFLSDKAARSLTSAIGVAVEREFLAMAEYPTKTPYPGSAAVHALKDHALGAVLSDEWKGRVGVAIDNEYRIVLEASST